MSIHFTCCYCQKRMKAPESAAGREVTCPSCQQRIEVPPAVQPPPVRVQLEEPNQPTYDQPTFDQPIQTTSGEDFQPSTSFPSGGKNLLFPAIGVMALLLLVCAGLIGLHNAGNPQPKGKAPAKPEATLANFYRLEEGMTYDEVVAIVGPPTQQVSSSQIAGYHTTMFNWEPEMLASMTLMFQNGRLISKSQFNLK